MFNKNQIKFINNYKHIGLCNVLMCSRSLLDFQEELRYLSGEIWDKGSIMDLITEIRKNDNSEELLIKINHLFSCTQWFTDDGRRQNEINKTII